MTHATSDFGATAPELPFLESLRREKRAKQKLQLPAPDAKKAMKSFSASITPLSRFIPPEQSALAASAQFSSNALEQQSMVRDVEKQWQAVKRSLEVRKPPEGTVCCHKTSKTAAELGGSVKATFKVGEAKRPEEQVAIPTPFSDQQQCTSNEDMDFDIDLGDDSAASKGINHIRVFDNSSLINGEKTRQRGSLQHLYERHIGNNHRQQKPAEEPHPENISSEASPTHEARAKLASRVLSVKSRLGEPDLENKPGLPRSTCKAATQISGAMYVNLQELLLHGAAGAGGRKSLPGHSMSVCNSNRSSCTNLRVSKDAATMKDAQNSRFLSSPKKQAAAASSPVGQPPGCGLTNLRSARASLPHSKELGKTQVTLPIISTATS